MDGELVQAVPMAREVLTMRQRTVCRRGSRKGFTLIELLVVVAIIALLISILLPSLARARELAKRSVCASNMKNIGNGLVIYGNINDDALPAAGPIDRDTLTYLTLCGDDDVFNPADIGAGNFHTSLSNTRNLATLIRDGDFAPKSLVCPSSDDKAADVEDPTMMWDFYEYTDGLTDLTSGDITDSGVQFVSYGYQVPYGEKAVPSLNLGGSDLPWAADKGPYGSCSDMNGGIGDNPGNPDPDPDWQAPPDEWRLWNSPNHGGTAQGEGQNVLYADAHAKWSNTPKAGMAYDNIYTGWGVDPAPAAPVDRTIRATGVQPAATGENRFSRSTKDALIYP